MAGETRRTGATDDYEAGMDVEGTVLHRDKLVARGLALAMLIGTIGFTAASIALAMGWGAEINFLSRLLTFVLTPLFPFVLLTRTVVRTVVTTEELQIQWGLWGPRIPLSAIRSVEVIPSERVRAEQKKRAIELYVPGHFEEAVCVEWRDESGKQRTALVGSEDPRGLASAIEEARAKKGVRVATADPIADAEREAEAEVEAEEGRKEAR
jgi:hypothetical protein